MGFVNSPFTFANLSKTSKFQRKTKWPYIADQYFFFIVTLGTKDMTEKIEN
jgi:hypothetical protein